MDHKKETFIILVLSFIPAYPGIRMTSDEEVIVFVDQPTRDCYITSLPHGINQMYSIETILQNTLTDLSLKRTWSRTLFKKLGEILTCQCHKRKPQPKARSDVIVPVLFYSHQNKMADTCVPAIVLFYYYLFWFLCVLATTIVSFCHMCDDYFLIPLVYQNYYSFTGAQSFVILVSLTDHIPLNYSLTSVTTIVSTGFCAI